MSQDKTPDARTLDRRGFLGAAAGVAAVAGAAASPFAWAAAAKGARDALRARPCARSRRPGAARSTSRSRAGLEHDGAVRGLHHLHEVDQLQRVGVRRQLPDGRPHGVNTGNTRAPGRLGRARQLREDVRLPVVGTHDGPAPTSAANLGSAITKMNAWNCNQLGAGSGYPAARSTSRARAPRSRTRARSRPGRRARTR